LPELANVPNEFVHEPWKMTQFQQLEYGCQLGVDYPNPITPPFSGRGHNNNKNAAGRGGSGNDRSAPLPLNSMEKNNNKQRKPNRNRKSNSHQAYEMKSVKQGNFRIEP
jgi:FAD binding domain of DNA photolyase